MIKPKPQAFCITVTSTKTIGAAQPLPYTYSKYMHNNKKICSTLNFLPFFQNNVLLLPSSSFAIFETQWSG